MSFTCEFVAENKSAARAQIAATMIPDAIKEFLTLAIDGLADDGLISVSSNGHLAMLGDPLQVTSLTLTVRRLHVVKSTAPSAPPVTSA